MTFSTKLIFRVKYTDQVMSLHKELRWLKVHERICYELAVVTYLSSKGLGPENLSADLVFASNHLSQTQLCYSSSNTMLIP